MFLKWFFIILIVLLYNIIPISSVGLLGLNLNELPPNDTIVGINVNLKPVTGLLAGQDETTIATTTQKNRFSSTTPTRVSSTTPTLGLRTDMATCGKRKVTHMGLIVNGQPTKPGDWPWHVALYRLKTSSSEQQYICGGTLLSQTRVLTAGHCVVENGETILPERLFAVMGKYNLAGGDIGSQERSVFEIVTHPEFDSIILENDIAILKLSSKVKFTNYVQPICLWNKDDTERTKIMNLMGTVVGWGFTQKDTPSAELMKAEMPVKEDILCIRSNPVFYSKFLTEKTYCAGFGNGTSACNGDSGGGMFFPTDDTWYLRGVVSLSLARKDKSLCDPNYFTIFTDAAQYLDFIEENMNIVH